MSHTLNIGTTSSDPKKVGKTYNLGIVVDIKLKEPCSVINPVFELDYNASYATCNYAYFPDWSRYYFIDNMVMKTGQRCELHCSVDVLQSYAALIKSLNATVVRQENLIEPYLPDPNYVYLDTYDVIAKLPTFDNSVFLASITGGTYYVLGINGANNNNLEDIEGYSVVTTEPADWGTNYMNYFINVGTINNPQLKIIYAAYQDGNLDSNQGTSYSYVSRYYTIYDRV